MRRKIFLSLFSLFFVFIMGSVVASVYVISATDDLSKVMELHKVDDLRQALVYSIRTVQIDLYSLGSPVPRKLDTIITNVEMMEDVSSRCPSCHHRADLSESFNTINERIAMYKGALSDYITASANIPRMEKLGLRAASMGEDLLSYTEDISRLAEAKFLEITENSLKRIRNVRLILIGTLGMMLFFGTIAALRLLKEVTRPIDVLVEGTRKIATGELGHTITYNETAEFRELTNHFNRMSEALKEASDEREKVNLELSREIAERKEAQEEVGRLMDQLIHARKMEAIGTLSGGIAHEFNNLLQVIQGGADLMNYMVEDGSPVKIHLKTIMDTSRRGADLTRRLLTFSRKMEGELKPLDVNEQMRHIFAILQQTLPRNIDIELDLWDETCTVMADVSGVEQIILNLALNSKDAMPEGGKLSLRTSHVDLHNCAQVDCDDNCEKCVAIEIVDNGHGMDEATLSSVFDPFFTTKEVGAGTGLGLSVTYGMVKAYGGNIKCESKVGEGTKFSIYLPCVEMSPEREIEEKVIYDEVGDFSGATILLADDEKGILDATSHALEEQGFNVKTASSGEEALEIYRQGGIDLLVVDLGMPGMGGLGCLREIAKLGEKMPPVIVATGYGFNEGGRDVLNKYARKILQKPYRLGEFTDVVKKVLFEVRSNGS